MVNDDKTVVKEENNSVPKLWGIPITFLTNTIQTIGVPTLFMIFICYLAWTYVPNVVSAHLNLLQRTGDTLDKMEETLKQSNKVMYELSEIEKLKPAFMQRVDIAHEDAQKSLNGIKDDITIIKKTVTGTAHDN